MLKRALRTGSNVLAVLLFLPVLALACLALAHYNIIRHTPGGLTPPAPPSELGAQVNPFSGTGGVPWMCAHNTPAATTPFGMVRLGPDTATMLVGATGVNRSGYYYDDNKLIGFSHTRLVGADAKEGGTFRVFPTTSSRRDAARRKDRFTRFSHTKETACPGYYAVWLPKEEVLAELTATPRVGIHRYTFRGTDEPHLLLDVTSGIGTHSARNGVVMLNPETGEIEGTARVFGSFSGRYDGLDIFFAARLSRPCSSWSVWNGDTFTPGKAEAAGDNIGVDLAFAPGGDPVEVRLAISYVSIANARLNLETEAADRSFDDVAAAARDAWEEHLSRIRITGGTERQRRIFYTALYRAFTMPTRFADVNGEYRGFDREVHKADGFQYYTDFSMWDTARTVHPLYNLIARAEQRDMMVSLVEMAKAGGSLPRWPSGCGYTNSMFGTPSDLTVSEAYLKGVQDFDVETAYAAMRRTAFEGPPPGSRFSGRGGLEWYIQYGYCPTDKMKKAVSATLEYGYEDHALSLFARALGHDADADILARRAQSYRNTWNPETQFFQPKDTAGVFQKEFRPFLLSYVDFGEKYTKDYVEGSAMQWRWFVPHDGQGLMSLFRSPEYFVSELEMLFTKSKQRLAPWNPGPYYWHGNEPGISSVYLFNAAGRPDLTQKWVRWILETKYEDNYVGLDGNDDGGTLSAWYVLSAMGFYPIAGTTRYELGAPLFDKAEINMGEKVLTVEAANQSPENMFVQRVTLNGAPLDRTWFEHDEIAGGGTLRFEMGPTPAL